MSLGVHHPDGLRLLSNADNPRFADRLATFLPLPLGEGGGEGDSDAQSRKTSDFCRWLSTLEFRSSFGFRAGDRAGFTLMELMVVLVVIGIVTAMIIPEMKGTFQDALLRSTSRELISAFDLTSSQAVSLNQLHRVRLDPRTGRYLVERRVFEKGQEDFAPVRDLPGGAGELDSRIAIEVRKSGETSPMMSDGGATAAESPARAQDVVFGFYPDGTADAGEILLRDRDGFQLALRINPITARVHIVEVERLSATTGVLP